MIGMSSSPTTAIIDEAVAAVQAAMSTIQNNAKAAGKGGSQSSYATFAALAEAAKPFLDANGIAVYQGGVEGVRSERLVTRLSKNGEWIESSFPVKVSNDGGQGFGAGLSFAKRWGFCAMLKLVTSDDAEEKQGYRDNRPPKAASRPRPDASLAGLLAGIRGAESMGELESKAATARAAAPIGESSTAVEQTISAWFCTSFAACVTLDRHLELRECANRIKVRGNEAREAMRLAGVRLEGGSLR